MSGPRPRPARTSKSTAETIQWINVRRERPAFSAVSVSCRRMASDEAVDAQLPHPSQAGIHLLVARLGLEEADEVVDREPSFARRGGPVADRFDYGREWKQRLRASCRVPSMSSSIPSRPPGDPGTARGRAAYSSCSSPSVVSDQPDQGTCGGVGGRDVGGADSEVAQAGGSAPRWMRRSAPSISWKNSTGNPSGANRHSLAGAEAALVLLQPPDRAAALPASACGLIRSATSPVTSSSSSRAFKDSMSFSVRLSGSGYAVAARQSRTLRS